MAAWDQARKSFVAESVGDPRQFLGRLEAAVVVTLRRPGNRHHFQTVGHGPLIPARPGQLDSLRQSRYSLLRPSMARR